MKFLYSYVPFLCSLVVGILLFNQSNIILHSTLWILTIAIVFVNRKCAVYFGCLVFSFQIGMFSRYFREQEFAEKEKSVQPLLNQKMILVGEVVTHPVPSAKSFSYVLQTQRVQLNDQWHDEQFRIQVSSKTFESPEKGDLIQVQTRLYVPGQLHDIQKIKNVHAYGKVFGDYFWSRLLEADLVSTRIRRVIFKSAQTHLSPLSYGYFRAMVFGDQTFLDQFTMQRLKETGLLHLFVISGFHIMFVWKIGFFLFRTFLSWIGLFHRKKNFFLWIETGSILSVLFFLQWINPPVSTFRAVGSMGLFLFLKLLRRYQHPLWNLGVVFFAMILLNPFFLFDISTQLTFASVAGILCVGRWCDEKLIRKYEVSPITKYTIKACAASLGAGIFTFPILYLQFGIVYPVSFLYNIVLVPTLGSLISFLSVASLVWSLIPWYGFQQVAFGLLDLLFQWFAKILFWQPKIDWTWLQNPFPLWTSSVYWACSVGLVGLAFIITRNFLKERAEEK